MPVSGAIVGTRDLQSHRCGGSVTAIIDENGAMQLLKIGKEQKLAAMLPVHTFAGDDYVLMLTRKGLLKRCRLSAFAKILSNGKTAISLVSPSLIASKHLTVPHPPAILLGRCDLALNDSRTT